MDLGVSEDSMATAKSLLARHLEHRERKGKEGDALYFDPVLWRIFTAMYKEAQRYRLKNLTISLIPIAICETEHELLFILQHLNLVNPSKVRQSTPEWIAKYTNTASQPSAISGNEVNSTPDNHGAYSQASQPAGAEKSAEPFIQMFTIDLGAKQRQDEAFPIIGRNTEIQRALNVLSRMLQKQSGAGR